MRDLRFLPQEIISAETGNEILELVVHALMGDDPEPPVQLFEPPTLQELYDLEVEGSEDSNEEAVNGFFTDSMLLAANEGLELDPPLDTFDTPGVIVESGTGVRKLPDLSSVDCDLHCYEDGFPPSDEEDHEKEQSMQTAAGEGVKAANVGFQLDCPELPGHGCKSCEFHRKNTGVKELLCSLCYMRTHCHFIYSPVSDADESPSPDSTTSPPEIQAPVPVDVRKPIPVKLKPGKRPAVEKLEDLLQGGDGPLDLSTRKRPRQ
ncbi:E1A 29.1 kDa protein [Human mastadenovirus B]|uniref:Early E1A protein n=2 Tax=Human mastadenovirus B TaxID=108098 RepID=Q8B8V0_ADE1P|nr:control protein E1A [Human mastadenovirus B]AAN62486.1 E1A 29.1 kDa protein [Human adenovirus 11]AAP49178.1 262 R [Human adenovirus 11]AAU09034.1 E1A 29.1 kDa protein [Human mastadenovirus B]QZA82818.1 control protein E1A [Human adenovirus 11]QZA82855.1 control protein E1A [Human adenovirus 11]